MFDRLVSAPPSRRTAVPRGNTSSKRRAATHAACSSHIRHLVPLLTRTALPTSSFGFYDHMLRLMVEDGSPVPQQSTRFRQP